MESLVGFLKIYIQKLSMHIVSRRWMITERMVDMRTLSYVPAARMKRSVML